MESCKTASFVRRTRRWAGSGPTLWNREEGEGLVEYAVVIIICLTMLFGIAGFGEALYSYHFVAHAAREATRYASVNGYTCASDSSCTLTSATNVPAEDSDVKTYVKGLAPLGIDSSQLTVSTNWPSTAGACGKVSNKYPGCLVQVQVGYTFTFTMPLVHIDPITFSSTSQTTITH